MMLKVNISSLLIFLSIFYIVEGKALQIHEDGANDGNNYNYIYESPYTESQNFGRYVPLIDGRPIFIPPLSSNLYETENTGFRNKKGPKHHWSSSYQNVGILPEQALDGVLVNQASSEKGSLHKTFVPNFPKKNKINTQIEKTYLVPSEHIKDKNFNQKYSYGKKLKKESPKSISKIVLGQMPEKKLGGYSVDQSTNLHSVAGNNKYDELNVNSDNQVNQLDFDYDDVTVVESQAIDYDYPKVISDLRNAPESEETYYNPMIVEKLIKETPSESYHDSTLMRDNKLKKQSYVDLEQVGAENAKVMETIPFINVDSLGNEELVKKEIVNTNILKDFPKEVDKSAVNDNYGYEEPHVIGALHKQNLLYKVPTETKPIKHAGPPKKVKPKPTVMHKPVKILNQKHKDYQKYVSNGQLTKVPLPDKKLPTQSPIEHKKKKQIGKVKPKKPLPTKTFADEFGRQFKTDPNQKDSEYTNLDTISKTDEEADSVLGKPINPALDSFTKEKPPITVVSNKNYLYKDKNKAIKEINKGENTNINKIKFKDEKQSNKNSPNFFVKKVGSHSENNEDYEILDKATLSNVHEVDLDSLENVENVPFEVGSGTIHESDSSQEGRNLFSESGIWSQMVNFHTQERSKFKKCTTPKNETGNCMPIQLCPDPNLALTLDDLVKKVCSIDDVFVGICCPEFSAETLKVDWENLNSNFSDLENDDVKPTVTCGQIVNSGEDVLSWPWMTPLISASTRRIFCGGVLISEQYVLTAAHCTRRIPRNQILVILGPLNATQDPPNQEFTVGEIKRHARYNPRTMQNDIALLKLLRPVPMGEFRRFICLPSEEESFVGQKAIMLGWQGSFEMTKNVEHLRVLSNEECRNNQGEDTLCTEPRTEDSMCNLDSGAPLIIEKEGTHEVIGILTWNRNDCDSRFPAKYTNVSHFRGWIEVHTSS